MTIDEMLKAAEHVSRYSPSSSADLITELANAVRQMAAENVALTSLIAENWNMRAVLRQLIAGRPGGVYFNKWEPLIFKALNEAPATDSILEALRTEAIAAALDNCSEYCDGDCVMDSNGIGYEDAQLRAQGAVALNEALLRAARRLPESKVLAQVPTPLSAAITDIIAERQRQQSVEGWTLEHDDEHRTGALARAAVCYASHAGNPHNKNMVDYQKTFSPARWPWSQDWWKPTNPRRDLVKAGALIAAEIERLDRATGGEVQS